MPCKQYAKGEDRLTKRVTRILAFSLTTIACTTAHAACPDKPVTMIVGFSPGGFTDVVARLVSKELEQRLAQTFVVENKPGAAGTIATELVARTRLV